VLPGIIGCLQANEALKLIAGYGEPLVGRLLTFDAQGTRFGEVKVRRDPRCPVCGDAAVARGNGSVAADAQPATEITAEAG
jgi:bacteriocin biosynthesis cyclodehydratase domain-containing protein